MATTWRAGPDTGKQREVRPTFATYDRAGKRYAPFASLPFVVKKRVFPTRDKNQFCGWGMGWGEQATDLH